MILPIVPITPITVQNRSLYSKPSASITQVNFKAKRPFKDLTIGELQKKLSDVTTGATRRFLDAIEDGGKAAGVRSLVRTYDETRTIGKELRRRAHSGNS